MAHMHWQYNKMIGVTIMWFSKLLLFLLSLKIYMRHVRIYRLFAVCQVVIVECFHLEGMKLEFGPEDIYFLFPGFRSLNLSG